MIGASLYPEHLLAKIRGKVCEVDSYHHRKGQDQTACDECKREALFRWLRDEQANRNRSL